MYGRRPLSFAIWTNLKNLLRQFGGLPVASLFITIQKDRETWQNEGREDMAQINHLINWIRRWRQEKRHGYQYPR